MTKITLKIEVHYGKNDFKRIMEDLVSKKLLDFKFNNKNNEKPYYNIDEADNYQESSQS